jgi:hypothetical protein
MFAIRTNGISIKLPYSTALSVWFSTVFIAWFLSKSMTVVNNNSLRYKLDNFVIYKEFLSHTLDCNGSTSIQFWLLQMALLVNPSWVHMFACSNMKNRPDKELKMDWRAVPSGEVRTGWKLIRCSLRYEREILCKWRSCQAYNVSYYYLRPS